MEEWKSGNFHLLGFLKSVDLSAGKWGMKRTLCADAIFGEIWRICIVKTLVVGMSQGEQVLKIPFGLAPKLTKQVEHDFNYCKKKKIRFLIERYFNLI